MTLKTRIVGPQEGHQHTHTVIFLHGKGSDCDEFSSEFLEMEASKPRDQPRTLLDLLPTIRWVFPSAPLTRSERFDCTESQWFDMWSVERPNERPELQISGLKQSIELVKEIVKQEEALVPRKKIFLGGISQGFATVYAAFASGDNKAYAGLLGFCTWAPSAGLALIQKDQEETSSITEDEEQFTPVFLGHSQDDEVVPIKEGLDLYHILRERGNDRVTFCEYKNGGHWINEPEGVDNIVAFIRLNTRNKTLYDR
ncbi:phospholipase/carboxylesterase [Hypoxylon sp. FL0543]|nr:phospholipase/carboxylesterase [Hypoxylon sp. FL0543]